MLFNRSLRNAAVSALVCSLLATDWAQTLSDIQAEEAKQKRLDDLQRAMKTLDDFDALIEQQTREFRTACLKAFGAPKFCECTANNRPAAFSFADYVAITTRSKKDNQFDKLDQKLQVAYDMVPQVRDRCVKLSGVR